MSDIAYISAHRIPLPVRKTAVGFSLGARTVAKMIRLGCVAEGDGDIVFSYRSSRLCAERFAAATAAFVILSRRHLAAFFWGEVSTLYAQLQSRVEGWP